MKITSYEKKIIEELIEVQLSRTERRHLIWFIETAANRMTDILPTEVTNDSRMKTVSVFLNQLRAPNDGGDYDEAHGNVLQDGENEEEWSFTLPRDY
jgi:hypothetical protein